MYKKYSRNFPFTFQIFSFSSVPKRRAFLLQKIRSAKVSLGGQRQKNCLMPRVNGERGFPKHPVYNELSERIHSSFTPASSTLTHGSHSTFNRGSLHAVTSRVFVEDSFSFVDASRGHAALFHYNF